MKIKGFTLIEVLVAMTIIAIAFSAILKVNADNIAQIIYLENRTTANWVGLQAINSLKAGTLSIANTAEKTEQTTQMLGKNWHWTIQLTGTQNPDIKHITATVYLENDRQHATKLIAYYSPPKTENYNAD